MKTIYFLLNLCYIYVTSNVTSFKSNDIINHIKQKQNLDQYGIPKNDDPNLDKVNFMLYTYGRRDPFIFDVNTDPQLLIQNGFNVTKTTKFVAHGWVATGLEFVPQFAEEYNSKESTSINVIGIDWGALAYDYLYLSSATYSVAVGKYSGEKIAFEMLINQLGQMPSQIEAVGHSLGAHLVGHLGRTIFDRSGEKISRVTGLDPAKPYFDVVSVDKRIQSTDAIFVDIIHTNSGELWQGAVSFTDTLGQVDFYPNGGSHQKGCTDVCIGDSCINIDFIDFFRGACSHQRAIYYFVESIHRSINCITWAYLNGGKECADLNENPDNNSDHPFQPVGAFVSTECDSYENFVNGNCAEYAPKELMGERALASMLPSKYLKYYLETNEEAPYSIS